MFRVNVIAVIELVQLVFRLMARNGGEFHCKYCICYGCIGLSGTIGLFGYKRGYHFVCQHSAAKELAPIGVRVNAVAPGIVKTERFAELYEDSKEKIDMHIS